MNTTLETALKLHAAGISVVPVMADGSKRPAGKWKQYTTSRATQQELHDWFETPGYGIGVVTGGISGSLEMLEIEGRAAHRIPELKDLADGSGLGTLFTRITQGWFEISPSGGYHWFYRITDQPVPGNTKIAQATDRETLAETRGEGGFVVTAPSAGTTHTTGKPWTLLAGGPGTIPGITMAERHAIHTVFAQLNEYTPHQPQEAGPSLLDALDQAMHSHGGHDSGTSPGDDYEVKTDWAQILDGWTMVFARGHTRYWRRPGKNDPGFSATTGHADDRDRLYVFTTSTEFQAETPYTKFGAYALLHHQGNHTNAAQALKTKGYGTDPRMPVVTQLPTPKPAAASVITTAGNNALATVHHLDDHRAEEQTIAITDDGNALTFIHKYGEVLRYNPDRGRWLHWNGSAWKWQSSDGGQARELAKKIARQMPDDEGWKAHKKRSLGAKGITDLLIQARTDERLTVNIDDLDAQPWELNTPAGIIDLRTGELGPADPAKLHTKTTAHTPDPDGDMTLWLDFLAVTFNGQQELIDYMQRLVGYSLIGEVREHILPFAYGTGGNGKGVFLDTLVAVLGDYATSSPNGFLMKSNYAQHTTEIARLKGARFVICSEVNQEDKFDEAKVKSLTGGDTLTARFMRQDDFTFIPTHHLWLMGNYQPSVEAGGDSFWRRLRLIPFTHTVPEDKVIEGLPKILSGDHGGAVLAWAAAGAAAYANGGLKEPSTVKEATSDYAASTDTVGRFLEEECSILKTAYFPGAPSTAVVTVVHEYEKWCQENGETAVRGRHFTTQLARHGVATGRNVPKGAGGARLYGGITLNDRQASALDEHGGDRGGY
ncbi:phage/plasmid primase, P4 family [Arthrobacter sp. GMC3]|uniref:phage/plasmid primase, P4 family n=1 Tax=Arthrobacter sp. GMC3 TaxID=2058894 RepID=UPI000CE4BEB3|nr:phage/plasmid primase, P4 family [Arthrobacter sp. GMC3]